MNRMLLRVCAIGGAVLGSLVVFVSTAQAATGVSTEGGTLVVNAAAVHNKITISPSNADFRVHDDLDTVVTTDPDCSVDGNDVVCPMLGINRILVRAGAGDDEVQNGTTEPSSLLGDAGDDKLTGGGSDDLIDGGTGADEFLGESGFDTADYRNRSTNLRVSLDGQANDGAVEDGGQKDNVKSDMEAVVSGSGQDVLIGSDDVNRLVGGDGDDSLHGRGGNDVLVGGDGKDTAVGDNGNDRADYGAAPDGREDVFNGGADTDTASYAQRTNGVNVTLDGVANDGGTGEGDNNFSNVENATGGAAGDTLIGNPLANRLVGGAGNDTINVKDGRPIDVADGGDGTGDHCIFDPGDVVVRCER